MRTIQKYIKISFTLFKFGIIIDTTYRLGFVLGILVDVFYFFATLLLFDVIYGNIESLAGWSRAEMMFLIGFGLLSNQMLIAFVFADNTRDLPDKIRNGYVDVVLLKPIHSLYFLTLGKITTSSLIPALMGAYLMGYAFIQGASTSVPQVVFGTVLFFCSLVTSYSISVIITSLAFRFPSTSQLSWLGFTLITNFTTRPHEMFAMLPLRIIFYYIIPVVLVASVPAYVFVREMNWWYVLWGVFYAILLLWLTITIWNRMIRYYSSASS